ITRSSSTSPPLNAAPTAWFRTPNSLSRSNIFRNPIFLEIHVQLELGQQLIFLLQSRDRRGAQALARRRHRAPERVDMGHRPICFGLVRGLAYRYGSDAGADGVPPHFKQDQPFE